ncbi:MAG TPA: hypothetical protein VHL11_25305 [Phototrophicaceae bacterium]|jgi:hypothetical protein|nr:hypothetical protein [Phototrophicaceae bacterium]
MPVGSLNESSLHAALKQAYVQPGDQIEVPVAGYLIDVVRFDPDNDGMPLLLIEIQTGNFSGMKRKLTMLLDQYPVRLVHPIALERHITLLDGETGEICSRRKSPKRGRVEEVFRELVSLPNLIHHPNFSLEVVLVSDEEIRVDDGKGSWRRKHQSIGDRHLIELVEPIHSRVFHQPQDLAALLPESLTEPFSVRDVATAAKLQQALAGKMVYCLRTCGAITLTGKARKANLYSRQNP